MLLAIRFLPVIAPSYTGVALVLFIGLPGLAAVAAGGVGAPLLDPTRCRSGGRAALGGAGIAAGALVVFSPQRARCSRR